MKLPALQWYPGDWLKDPGVNALSYEEQGIWFRILMHMFEGEERGKLTLNGHAMPVEALARLLGLDNQILTTHLTKLLTYGVASVEPETGIIFNRRMVRDEEIRNIRVKSGKKGGNPRLVNQKSNQPPTTPVNQPPTPSSSSSSSSSSSEEEEGGADAPTPKAHKKFTAPNPREVRAYGAEIGFDIDAERFCDHYASKGWVVGKSSMKDWRAAVRTWRSTELSTPVTGKRKSTTETFGERMDRELSELRLQGRAL